LEVLLALWLIGLAAFGAISIQLWAVRAQQATLWRVYALNLAEAAAEALRGGYPVARLTMEWRLRAARLLPYGEMQVIDHASEMRLIVLSWSRPTQWFGNLDKELGDPYKCPTRMTGATTQCLVLAIAK